MRSRAQTIAIILSKFKRKGHAPSVRTDPAQRIRDLASQYMMTTGRAYRPPEHTTPVNAANGKILADEYAAMKHDPNNPAVKKAYAALIKETHAQYLMLKASGIRISIIDPSKPDPYREGASAMHRDVQQNNHMWLFPTSAGFGSNATVDTSASPLLKKTGEVIDGYAMTANDEFRIVHDYFGHAKENQDFGPDGEDNAWRSHAAMYSDEARGAMTTETRGQNSWVYYGPNGKANREGTAPTVFADQKTGLMKRKART